ncbi:MAG: MobF family relaxase, partial [Acidimicrobiales bacterium]
VVAYDCTFSTPKSVSLLHALSRGEVAAEVRKAHEAAVSGALGYLERHGLASRRRSGTDDWRVPVTGAVAAAFVHRMSRAPDPHLHSHVLVANLGLGEDGRWAALDSRSLYEEISAAGALYETHLRAELTRRLEVAWQPLRGHWADLEGTTRNEVVTFSRRTTESEVAARESELEGPAAVRLMAEILRPEKDVSVPYETQLEGWKERSFEAGMSATRVDQLTGRGAWRREASRTAAQEGLGEGSGRSWIEGAGDRLGGSFSRSDLVRARCRALPLGGTVAEVERSVGEALADSRVVASKGRYSTVDRIAEAASWRTLLEGAAESVRAEVLCYEPGERLQALDGLSARSVAVEQTMGRAIAIAPGRRAAASFEGATGIETLDVRYGLGLAVGSDPYDVVVVADAARFRADELSRVLDDCAARDAQLVLLGSRRALADSPYLCGMEKRLRSFELAESLQLAADYAGNRLDVAAREFGESTVVISRSSVLLRREAVAVAIGLAGSLRGAGSL